MSKAQELKPCPFCGGTESFVERLDYSAAYVQCDSEVSPGVACMARGPVGVQESDDEDVPGSDAAIREWNRRPASSEQQAAQQEERIAKIEKAYIELSWIFHDQIVAQQSAWIEWQHGAGAEAGMQWIENGLCGPGHIPDEDEPYGKEAQAWYDANNSDPFPVCQCGRPSNMMWMGQGFCCQAHSDAARASNGGKA